VISTSALKEPARAVGSFYAMSLDTLLAIPRRPFAWRELLLQTWFVARVSVAPTLMLIVPFTVLTVFTVNILLTEIGAADFSGSGAALGIVTQTGPVVTVLVVAGAAATAMCADLGARTIREELDALRVLGIDPVQALVVPGSGLVKQQAEQEGLDRVLLEAGFEWRDPCCSMCLGMNPDKLTPGQRCASTSNRNFEGRQGQGGRTHLVSPAMAAAAAVTGRLTDVRQLV